MSSSFSDSKQQLAALRAEADAAVSERFDESSIERETKRVCRFICARWGEDSLLVPRLFRLSVEVNGRTLARRVSLERHLWLRCIFHARTRKGRTRSTFSPSHRRAIGTHFFVVSKNALSSQTFPHLTAFPSSSTTTHETTPKNKTGPVGLGDEGRERGPPRGHGVPEGKAQGRREALGRGARRGAGLARGGAGRRGAIPRGGRQGAAARRRAAGEEGGGGGAEEGGDGGGGEGDKGQRSRLCFGVFEFRSFRFFSFPCCCSCRCCCSCAFFCPPGLTLDACSGAARPLPFARGPHAPDSDLVVVRRGRRRGRRRGGPPGVSRPQAPLRGGRSQGPRDAQDGSPGSSDGEARGLALGDESGSGREGGRSCRCRSSLAGSGSEAAARPVPRRLDLQDRRPAASAVSKKDSGGGGSKRESSCFPRRRGCHCRFGGAQRGGGGRRKSLGPAALLRRGRREGRLCEAKQPRSSAAAAFFHGGGDSESSLSFSLAAATRNSNSDDSSREKPSPLFFLVHAPSSLAVRQRHRMEGRAPPACAPGGSSSGNGDERRSRRRRS